MKDNTPLIEIKVNNYQSCESERDGRIRATTVYYKCEKNFQINSFELKIQ